MSSASTPVAAPKHDDGDRALVLPGTAASGASATDADTGSSNGASVSAALSRAFAGMLAFMFKRPIRLFRPVKISTMAGIQAIAEERGRSVTPAFVRGLIRNEGWRFFPRHILPPLTINAVIGLTLFTTYTTSERLLRNHLDSPLSTFVVIPFISGASAGAAQSIISAPLDNARHLLLRRQRFLRQASELPRLSRRQRIRLAASDSAGLPFTSWWSLLRDSVFRAGAIIPAAPASLPVTLPKSSGRERLERARRWARRGWSFFSLSVAKDSVAFGVFFVVFEVGREAARRIGLAYDGIDVPALSNFDEKEGAVRQPEKQRRSASGLILQSVLILVSGGLAGYIFSIVARPFERIRAAIYEGRARWAEKQPGSAGPKTARPSSSDDKQHKRTRRARSAGGASERRSAAELGKTGRKAFAVRIGHIRSVSRSVLRTRRRREAKTASEFEGSQTGQHRTTTKRHAAAESATCIRQDDSLRPVQPAQPKLTSTPVPTEMPTATALVRRACRVYGPATFLFAPRSTLQAIDAGRHRAPILSSNSTKLTPPSRRPISGPTRLSARARQSASSQTATSSRLLRVGGTILRYVPPYAIGFFAYAMVSGDLKIEV